MMLAGEGVDVVVRSVVQGWAVTVAMTAAVPVGLVGLILGAGWVDTLADCDDIVVTHGLVPSCSDADDRGD